MEAKRSILIEFEKQGNDEEEELRTMTGKFDVLKIVVTIPRHGQ